jgi:hypothetical protein
VREQVVQLGWRTLRTTPKAGSERVLALDAGTAAVLAEHRQRQAAELRYLGLDPAATAEVFTRADGQLVHPTTSRGTSAGWSARPDCRPSGCTTCGTGQRRWRWPAAWR